MRCFHIPQSEQKNPCAAKSKNRYPAQQLRRNSPQSGLVQPSAAANAPGSSRLLLLCIYASHEVRYLLFRFTRQVLRHSLRAANSQVVRPLASHPVNNSEDTYIRKPIRYSSGWSIIAFVLHFGGTFAIVGLNFLAGMGSFTRDTSSEVSFWLAVQWLWTPLAMMAWDPQNMLNEGRLFGLALLWSCVVAVFSGFVFPLIKRRIRLPQSHAPHDPLSY